MSSIVVHGNQLTHMSKDKNKKIGCLAKRLSKSWMVLWPVCGGEFFFHHRYLTQPHWKPKAVRMPTFLSLVTIKVVGMANSGVTSRYWSAVLASVHSTKGFHCRCMSDPVTPKPWVVATPTFMWRSDPPHFCWVCIISIASGSMNHVLSPFDKFLCKLQCSRQ